MFLEQYIIIFSEGSCDTEDWKIQLENSAVKRLIAINHIQKVFVYKIYVCVCVCVWVGVCVYCVYLCIYKDTDIQHIFFNILYLY